MKNLYTTGDIAKLLDERTTRVEYVIRRERLQPVDRVGITRLFSDAQIEVIKKGLYNMRIQRT